MKCKTANLLLIGFAIFALLAFAIAIWPVHLWTGSVDLTVQFAVVDSKTNIPIKDSTIHVIFTGLGFYSDSEMRRDKEDIFQLHTDSNGIAMKICHNTMTVGSDGSLFRSSDYSVRIPSWYVNVTASGYQSSGWFCIDQNKHKQQIIFNGNKNAIMIIPVKLLKATNIEQ